jgi:hypothetical protein
MKRLLFILVASVAVLAGAAEAHADVNASASVYAEAGPDGGGATVISHGAAAGSAGVPVGASFGWPLAAFPSASTPCPSTGCAERSGGATASVDEAAGVLKAGAGASLLVGNAPDPNYGGDADVSGDATISDGITLSQAATVWVEGTVHGTIGAANSAPLELLDPTAEVDVSLDFCCTFRWEALQPLGGYDEQYVPETNAGPTPIDDTFSVPVDLPAGHTSFSGELKAAARLLVDGAPSVVYAQNALLDFDGTVTFHVRVPDDVVATSDSGFLPIVGGASAVDTVAPTTVATQSPEAGWADWSKGPVTVHLAATDTGGSGVDSITYSASGAGAKPETIVHGDSADVVVSAEGATTLTFHATDAAGNAEAPQTLTIRIDDTGPGVTATISPSPNAAGWRNTPTTLTLHATDAASGVRSLTFDGVTADRDTVTISFGSAADDGVRTIRYHATDDLGNVGPEQTVTVRFDDLPPVVTAPHNGSWWVDATGADGAVVTYALGIQDNLDPSPAVDCDRPSGSLFPIGGDKVTCTVTDVAGNATTVVFWVDVRGAPDQIELELPVVGADSLNGLVSSAGRAARAGRTQEACNELNAYVHELNALTGKVIDPATAENRLETVGRVRTVLGCG